MGRATKERLMDELTNMVRKRRREGGEGETGKGYTNAEKGRGDEMRDCLCLGIVPKGWHHY